MFCKNCGKEIPNEARFCPNCGQEIEYVSASSDSGQQNESGNQASESDPAPNESGNQESDVIAIAVCFAAISMILGIVGMLFGLLSRTGAMLIFAIFALVFCSMSRQRNHDTLLDMARAGQVLGIIELIICVIALIYMYVLVHNWFS